MKIDYCTFGIAKKENLGFQILFLKGLVSILRKVA